MNLFHENVYPDKIRDVAVNFNQDIVSETASFSFHFENRRYKLTIRKYKGRWDSHHLLMHEEINTGIPCFFCGEGNDGVCDPQPRRVPLLNALIQHENVRLSCALRLKPRAF